MSSQNNITPQTISAPGLNCARRLLISKHPKINGTVAHIKGIEPIFGCRQNLVVDKTIPTTIKISKDLPDNATNSITNVVLLPMYRQISLELKRAADDAVEVKDLRGCEKRKPNTWCNVPIKIALRLIDEYSIRHYEDEDFYVRMFRIESAFYQYLDHHSDDDEGRQCTLFAFARHLHNVEPTLRSYVAELDSRYESWIKHKNSLPTYGAAILSEDASRVLMVQSSVPTEPWGFPKGKIDGPKEPIHCAIREVQEEIGFDITQLIKDDYYIEYRDSKGKKSVRLYIIEGVSTHTKFTIKCQNEIRAFDWKLIDSLSSRGSKIRISTPCKFLIGKLKRVKKDILLRNPNTT